MAKTKVKSAVYNILAFTFDGKHAAKEVVKEIKESGALEGQTILADVVVEIDERGKFHMHEPGHGIMGAGVGAVATGLLSLIGGPAGLLAWAVAGGVVGGVAGKYLGRPIKKGDLEEIADAMPPDSSAFLLLMEDRYTEDAINLLSPYNANVITLTVGDELSEQITSYMAGM